MKYILNIIEYGGKAITFVIDNWKWFVIVALALLSLKLALDVNEYNSLYKDEVIAHNETRADLSRAKTKLDGLELIQKALKGNRIDLAELQKLGYEIMQEDTVKHDEIQTIIDKSTVVEPQPQPSKGEVDNATIENAIDFINDLLIAQ